MNDKFHGQGIKTWGQDSEWSGDMYIGNWKDGLMSGQGTYYFADGDKYVGEHMNNNRYGQGTYYFADGAYDVGEWKEGVLNGFATSYNADGSLFKQGIWKDDEFQYSLNPQLKLPLIILQQYHQKN